MISANPEAIWGMSDKLCHVYAIGNTVVFGDDPTHQAAIAKRYYESVAKPDANRAIVGKKLNSEEIQMTLSGANVTGRTMSGLMFSAALDDSGSISVKTISKNPTLAQQDQGLWWVKNDKFCSKFKKFCSAPGSLDTSLSHAAGLIEIAACHA